MHPKYRETCSFEFADPKKFESAITLHGSIGKVYGVGSHTFSASCLGRAKSKLDVMKCSDDAGKVRLTFIVKKDFFSGDTIQTSQATSASTPKSGGTKSQASSMLLVIVCVPQLLHGGGESIANYSGDHGPAARPANLKSVSRLETVPRVRKSMCCDWDAETMLRVIVGETADLVKREFRSSSGARAKMDQSRKMFCHSEALEAL